MGSAQVIANIREHRQRLVLVLPAEHQEISSAVRQLRDDIDFLLGEVRRLNAVLTYRLQPGGQTK